MTNLVQNYRFPAELRSAFGLKTLLLIVENLKYVYICIHIYIYVKKSSLSVWDATLGKTV